MCPARVNVGDEAPDFCVMATHAEDGKPGKRMVCLRDFRGKQPVILEFYGAAFTPT